MTTATSEAVQHSVSGTEPHRTLGKSALLVSWTAQVVAAGIYTIAALPKLTSQADAVATFSALGAEPFGRFAIGIAEVVAVVLLLIPRTAWAGAGFGLAVIVGAIGAHLTRLGIAPGGDPTMFIMAIVVLLATATTLVVRRGQVPVIGHAIQ